MSRYPRVTLGFAILAFLAFASQRAAAQQPKTEEAARRIAALEERIGQLEQKVRRLEASQAPRQPTDQQTVDATKWRVIANWRRLKQGMSMDKVTALLGDPDRVDAGPVTHWRWGNSQLQGVVSFIDEKVIGWSEPR